MNYQKSNGQMIKISEMSDAYLLNAYVKCRKRLEILKGIKGQNAFQIAFYVQDLMKVFYALKDEVKKRNLI